MVPVRWRWRQVLAWLAKAVYVGFEMAPLRHSPRTWRRIGGSGKGGALRVEAASEETHGDCEVGPSNYTP